MTSASNSKAASLKNRGSVIIWCIVGLVFLKLNLRCDHEGGPWKFFRSGSGYKKDKILDGVTPMTSLCIRTGTVW